MLRTLKAFDLKNKKVLMRVDFNTPLKNSKVSDNFRIKSTLPSIKTCIEGGAALTLMSHVGRPNGKYDKKLSLMPIGEELASLLQMPIKFSNDCVHIKNAENATPCLAKFSVDTSRNGPQQVYRIT